MAVEALGNTGEVSYSVFALQNEGRCCQEGGWSEAAKPLRIELKRWGSSFLSMAPV